MSVITIRPAVAEDSSDLFTWRNDEQTRSASRSQLPITWDEHSEWFTRSLASSRRLIYLAIQDGESVGGGAGPIIGMCRFDRSDDSKAVEVSINMNPRYRGQGLSGQVLRAAINRFRQDSGSTTKLTATVRTDNIASARLFTGSGFQEISADTEFSYYQAN